MPTFLASFLLCGFIPCPYDIMNNSLGFCYTGDVQVVNLVYDLAPRDCGSFDYLFNEATKAIEETDRMIYLAFEEFSMRYPGESYRLDLGAANLVKNGALVYWDHPHYSVSDPIDFEMALCQ